MRANANVADVPLWLLLGISLAASKYFGETSQRFEFSSCIDEKKGNQAGWYFTLPSLYPYHIATISSFSLELYEEVNEATIHVVLKLFFLVLPRARNPLRLGGGRILRKEGTRRVLFFFFFNGNRYRAAGGGHAHDEFPRRPSGRPLLRDADPRPRGLEWNRACC